MKGVKLPFLVVRAIVWGRSMMFDMVVAPCDGMLVKTRADRATLRSYGCMWSFQLTAIRRWSLNFFWVS